MSSHILINEALRGLGCTNYSVNTDGDIVFANESDKPEQSIIDAKVAELVALQQANQYKRSRLKEYPSIGDQLDALFHAGVFPTEMAEQIQAIKDKYPKGQP